jgi:CRP/FNR family cyclic AMP-dependent transcriptional regulator
MTDTLAGVIRNELLPRDASLREVAARRFTPVFTEGDPADTLYLLSSGLVKLYHRSPDGKEVIFHVVSAGDIFGEEAIEDDARRGCSAEVLQDAVCLPIPRSTFLEFADSHPGFWRAFSHALIGRERGLCRKVEMLCLREVESRILFYLRDLASRLRAAGQEADFEIPLSQSELANLIGATRETTSTTLNSLARKGQIKLGRRLMIVPALHGNNKQEDAPVQTATSA